MNFDLLNITFNAFSYRDIISYIENSMSQKKQCTIGYANFNLLLDTEKDESLKKGFSTFSIMHPDGIGVNIGLKYKYRKNFNFTSINGTDLYFKILEYASSKNFKVFFFGGSIKANAVLDNSVKEKYPGINFCGSISRESRDCEEIIREINSKCPDILFVGTGSPHQEEFIITNKENINSKVIISSGSGIDFISGSLKRAPCLVRSIKLEWLYRIYREPSRLWKRYLLGIPCYILKLIKSKK